jgi:hypothetical protein
MKTFIIVPLDEETGDPDYTDPLELREGQLQRIVAGLQRIHVSALADLISEKLLGEAAD